MRVPVEQDDNTVKVELKVPKGVNVANVAPVQDSNIISRKIKKAISLKLLGQQQERYWT